jgi:hypothetical protein
MISELRDKRNGRIGMVQTEAQKKVIGEVLRLRHSAKMGTTLLF